LHLCICVKGEVLFGQLVPWFCCGLNGSKIVYIHRNLITDKILVFTHNLTAVVDGYWILVCWKFQNMYLAQVGCYPKWWVLQFVKIPFFIKNVTAFAVSAINFCDYTYENLWSFVV